MKRTLKLFLDAEEEGITLNMDKIQFGFKETSMPRHIFSAGSKRPDPKRLRALNEYTVRCNVRELPCLTGFFAYNAKWVPLLKQNSAAIRNSKTTSPSVEFHC